MAARVGEGPVDGSQDIVQMACREPGRCRRRQHWQPKTVPQRLNPNGLSGPRRSGQKQPRRRYAPVNDAALAVLDVLLEVHCTCERGAIASQGLHAW